MSVVWNQNVFRKSYVSLLHPPPLTEILDLLPSSIQTGARGHSCGYVLGVIQYGHKVLDLDKVTPIMETKNGCT